MHLRTILLVILAFLTVKANAQFSRKKKKAEGTQMTVQQPTSLAPSSSTQREYAPKASQKTSKGPTYGLEQKYYERMEAVAKERRKAERIMEKPQYSNPMYFGHKRPPKKRKPSKMKFCKECGIRH